MSKYKARAFDTREVEIYGDTEESFRRGARYVGCPTELLCCAMLPLPPRSTPADRSGRCKNYYDNNDGRPNDILFHRSRKIKAELYIEYNRNAIDAMSLGDARLDRKIFMNAQMNVI